MPITRNTDQSDTSLEEFYSQLMSENNEQTLQIGKQMLSFTELINKTFTETQLWGLTSLYRLVIQNSDDFTLPWYIIVIGNDQEFHFEYLVPDHQAPWQNAYVRGTCKPESAISYLIISMKRSGGWVGNNELEKLAEEILNQ